MILLFADVLIEDPQLYEFNQWTSGYFNLPIVRVSRELTPWELFRREGLIANTTWTVQRSWSGKTRNCKRRRFYLRAELIRTGLRCSKTDAEALPNQ